MRTQQFPVLRLDDGRQLVQVADHQQLHPAERTLVITVSAKHVVHGVEQVCPHHTDFVDHEQVERAQELILSREKRRWFWSSCAVPGMYSPKGS